MHCTCTISWCKWFSRSYSLTWYFFDFRIRSSHLYLSIIQLSKLSNYYYMLMCYKLQPYSLQVYRYVRCVHVLCVSHVSYVYLEVQCILRYPNTFVPIASQKWSGKWIFPDRWSPFKVVINYSSRTRTTLIEHTLEVKIL